ncbi:SGNH/GDSL hydrolase family protein [Catellatospora vulcania]|uniref:SGNH/GDSL hydrolase family protein n=1 Tax=Catellatospora vulcania TaxID=1460450 RepID=UPI0012D450D2|nr:SGNH/GDSL hydrolase family protein [Catellatospora vulcania]
MGQIAVRASRPLAFAVAPILLAQGVRVRRRTPVLPEAAGERHGVEGDPGTEPLAVLVLGESTAAGVGVPSQADGLGPAIASGLARHSGRPVTWRVTAHTGFSARKTLARLVPQLPEETYDVVVVVLGVNDMLEMRSARAWQNDITALLAALRPYLRAGGRIVLAGVPDVAGFPTLPQPTRTLLALHARHLDRRLAHAAASTPSAVHVPSPRIDEPGLFAEDGFHPGAAGYRRWAAHLVDALTTPQS